MGTAHRPRDLRHARQGVAGRGGVHQDRRLRRPLPPRVAELQHLRVAGARASAATSTPGTAGRARGPARSWRGGRASSATVATAPAAPSAATAVTARTDVVRRRARRVRASTRAAVPGGTSTSSETLPVKRSRSSASRSRGVSDVMSLLLRCGIGCRRARSRRRRPVRLGEPDPQRGHGLRGLALHRSRRDAQHVGDLRLREVLVVAEDDHRPLPRRQRAQRLPERLALQRGVRDGGRRAVRDAGDEGLAAKLAPPADPGVDHRPPHVGLRVVAAAPDRPPADAGALQRALDQVERVVAVAGEGMAEPQQRRHPHPHECREVLVHASPSGDSPPTGHARRAREVASPHKLAEAWTGG